VLSAVITLDADPELQVGPLTLAWHGIGIAAGIGVGWLIAGRYAKRRELDRERLLNVVLVMILSGMVGARAFYLLLNDPAALVRSGDWLGTRGFAFYGAMILGTLSVGIYLRRARLGLRYLDALAAGFPLGMAVGRIGDVINGEHHGPPSDAPWAIRYLHPDADVPSSAVAYHPGGLYEIVVALVIAPIVWWLSRRLSRPGMLLWAVIGLYAAGRFLIFFYRSDSEPLALGLEEAQWTSIGLIAAAGTAAWLASRGGGSAGKAASAC